MAHWAKINESGIVENVVVTSNEEVDEGESWIAENLEGAWVKTSYNTRKNAHSLGGTPFRKNFAVPGGSYIASIDAFVPAKADGEEDFVLNEELGIWVPPIAIPSDADFVVAYGPDITEIPEGSKVYYWMPEELAWGMAPNTPKPEGIFNWDPIAKEWVESEEPVEPTE